MKSVFEKVAIAIVLLLLTLTCTYCSGSTRSGSVHQLSAAPGSVNFGNQMLNKTAIQTITLTNAGTGVLQIQSVSINGSNAFVVAGWSGQMALQPSSSLQLAVAFTPTTQTSYSGTLTISSNAQSDQVIKLVGTGALSSTGVTVSVLPSSANLQTGSSLQFAASITGTSNTGVNWLVGGVPGGSSTLGSINSSGLYTAPSTAPATSTVMVTANSIQDPTASASASVDITAATINPVAVSIAPTSASLQAGQTKQFSATVSGTTNIGVNWLVNGTLGGSSSVGTIDSTGYYRAPSTLSLNLTVIITATSVVDTSKSANATVNLTAPAAISPVGQYYVSPTGSDSNSGTQAAPFHTIQRAADVVNPGDTVIVEDGVYSNSAASGNNSRLVTMSRGGTAASPVTFRAQNKWGAVLDGLNNTTADGMGVAANYITIQDFEIRNFGNGVSGGGLGIENDSGGTNLSILGNNIHDIGRMCTDTSNGEVGIFLANDSVTVSGNLIHDIGRFAPGENGCQPSTGYYQNHDHGIYIALGSHYKIQNNIFYANRRGWAIQLYPSALDDVQIVNNTFADPNPYRDGHIVITPSAITNSLIANNIFYQPTNAALYCGASGPNSLTVANNLTTVSQMCNASMSGTSFSNNLVSQSSSGLMVDPSNHNYHLATGSPAIDAGTSTNAPSTDYDGISRPQGAGYDIGAYEWR